MDVRTSAFDVRITVQHRGDGKQANSQAGEERPVGRGVPYHPESEADSVLVEFKAVKAIASEHQAQIINYLIATSTDVGLLINFGNPKLEYKRFTRNTNIDGHD